MKRFIGVLALCTGLLAVPGTLFGQGVTKPVVTVRAADPAATWQGDPGAFLLLRDGPTNEELNVYFSTYGSATNGWDYEAIPHTIKIPAGVRTNLVKVAPIDRGQTGVRTVNATLLFAMAVVVNYNIGYPSNATVVISSSKTNLPPAVEITSPPDGASIAPYAVVSICANATDPDGYVQQVEFFCDGTSLGIKTNNPAAAGPLNPFCLFASNLPLGQHVLTAKARDNQGAIRGSGPVHITIKEPLPAEVNISVLDPQGTEIPPVPPGMGMPQRIDPASFLVTRTGDTWFPMTVYYTLTGTASNGLDYVRLDGSLEIPIGASGAPLDVLPMFDTLKEGTETVTATLEPIMCIAIYPPPPGCYQLGMHTRATVYINDAPVPTNGSPLVRITSPPNLAVFRSPLNLPIFAFARDVDGTVEKVEFFAGTNRLGLGARVIAPTASSLVSSNMFSLVWSNVPPGEFALRAQATDNDGLSQWSEPVHIRVTSPPPPPPTNQPVIVTINASDPIALEGTNCWTWRQPDLAQPTWASWRPDTSWRWMTNCGPKNGAFTISRRGLTNDDLAVSYAISGTATNGTDYLPLAGTVTIPAGARSAIIPVVPIDDGTVERGRTVVLTLKPGAGYRLGMPNRAAVFIYDSLRPRPYSSLLWDRCFHLRSTGPSGDWFRIESSGDMRQWTPVCTNQVVDGSIDFVDPDANTEDYRFYRAVPTAAPE